jgi:hypothetical protein
MAFIAKLVKDMDTAELRELLSEVLRLSLGHKFDVMAEKLERIAKALEKKN